MICFQNLQSLESLIGDYNIPKPIKPKQYKFKIMYENNEMGSFIAGSRFPDFFVSYNTSLWKNSTELYTWFYSRFIGNINSYNVIIPPSCGFPRGCRERIRQEAIGLSIVNHGIIPSDHFWYNPTEECDITFLERTVHLKPTTWEQINPYQNFRASHDLYSPIFYDDIGNCEINNIGDYLFSTPGDRAKRWIQENGTIYLEKRSKNKEYWEKEDDCFKFFSSKNIIIPNYKLIHKTEFTEEEKNCGYDSDTLKEGIYIVRKKCLTDLDSELIPLSKFFRPTLTEILQEFKSHYNITDSVLDSFSAAIQEYVQKNNIKFVDYNNFGFIRKGQEYLPAVWSNVDKYVFLWYQKTEVPFNK